MSLSLILPMSAFALAASISPGPVNLVCLSSGTRYPVHRGLIFVTGATLGFIALFIAVGLGLYSLLNVVPAFDALLRWAGVAFLLYLSVKLAMDSGHLPDDGTDQAPGFGTGALMQWLNPKAWLASASGIGAYTSANDLQQILLGHDLDLVGLEAGDGDRDPIAVVGDPLEVEGGVILAARLASGRFEHVEEPVEADRRAAEGGQVDLTHLVILQ